MARSNQLIIQELLDAIVKTVSEGSSSEYILMVLKRFVESHAEIFPFAKYVHIDLNGIRIDEEINSVEPKPIGKFLGVMIKTLFSGLFMLLVVKKLNTGLVKDLDYLGVKIENLKK